MKEVKFALTMGLVTIIVFIICFFSGCFDEKAKTVSVETSTPNFSKVQDYIDSLEKREEVVLLDTIITHFGHRPGYLEHDTVYKLSYQTKNVLKANKAKLLLQKNKCQALSLALSRNECSD